MNTVSVLVCLCVTTALVGLWCFRRSIGKLITKIGTRVEIGDYLEVMEAEYPKRLGLIKAELEDLSGCSLNPNEMMSNILLLEGDGYIAATSVATQNDIGLPVFDLDTQFQLTEKGLQQKMLNRGMTTPKPVSTTMPIPVRSM